MCFHFFKQASHKLSIVDGGRPYGTAQLYKHHTPKHAGLLKPFSSLNGVIGPSLVPALFSHKAGELQYAHVRISSIATAHKRKGWYKECTQTLKVDPHCSHVLSTGGPLAAGYFTLHINTHDTCEVHVHVHVLCVTTTCNFVQRCQIVSCTVLYDLIF